MVLTEHIGNIHFLTINTFASNPEDAQELNKVIVETYKTDNELKFKKIYDELIITVEQEISKMEEDVFRLSIEAEDYLIGFNKKLFEEIDIQDDFVFETDPSAFLPLHLKNEIETSIDKLNYLEDILDNLKKNEDFYTTSIEIISDNGIRVDENFTYFRNILLSVISAFLIGIIFTYMIDYIIIIKNKKDHMKRL